MALMFYSGRSGHDDAATPKFMEPPKATTTNLHTPERDHAMSAERKFEQAAEDPPPARSVMRTKTRSNWNPQYFTRTLVPNGLRSAAVRKFRSDEEPLPVFPVRYE